MSIYIYMFSVVDFVFVCVYCSRVFCCSWLYWWFLMFLDLFLIYYWCYWCFLIVL